MKGKKKDKGGGSAPPPAAGPPGMAPAGGGDSGGEEEEEEVEETQEPQGATEEQVRGIVRDANQELVEKIDESTEEIKTEIQNNTEYLKNEVANEAKNLTEFIGKVEKNLTKKITVVDISVQESLLQQNQLSYLITEQAIIDLRQRLPELLETAKKLKGLLPVKYDECSEIIQCNVCVKNKKCGWCESEKRCIQGDKIGPINQICPFYSFTDCSSPNCAQYLNCSTCLLSPGCGWCRDQSQLIEGCIEADENYKGCPEYFHMKGQNTECIAPIQQQQELNNQEFENSVETKLERESQIEAKTPTERNLFQQQVVISLKSKSMIMKDIYDTILQNFKKLQDLKYEYQLLQQEVDKRKADQKWQEEYEEKKKKKENETNPNSNSTQTNSTDMSQPQEGEQTGDNSTGNAESQNNNNEGEQKEQNNSDNEQKQAKIKKLNKEEFEELKNKYIEDDPVLLEVKQFLEDYEQHNLELQQNQITDEEEQEELEQQNQFLIFIQKPSYNQQNSRKLCSLLEEIYQL